jgi:hypothetical protein
VLWEASDRVCSKRLRALLPVILPSLERYGHLRLNEAVRTRMLAMSAATIDRLLRPARRVAKPTRPRRVVPEPRRKIPVRTFTDWNDPPPGSMDAVRSIAAATCTAWCLPTSRPAGSNAHRWW